MLFIQHGITGIYDQTQAASPDDVIISCFVHCSCSPSSMTDKHMMKVLFFVKMLFVKSWHHKIHQFIKTYKFMSTCSFLLGYLWQGRGFTIILICYFLIYTVLNNILFSSLTHHLISWHSHHYQISFDYTFHFIHLPQSYSPMLFYNVLLLFSFIFLH